jgi:pimeloyl-ACP methyl ester carboxylesterase
MIASPQQMAGEKSALESAMKPKNLQKIFKIATFAAAGVASAFVGSMLFAGWWLVRPGGTRIYDCIPRIPFGTLEPIELTAADGLTLHAWVLRSRTAAPCDWVLLLHGYRSDRDVLHTRARFFARRGFNVLLLHFRGHGSSEKARISYGYHERIDVAAAFDFIRNRYPDQPSHIGIVGISMGAAAASYAVDRGDVDPDWMILESCYDNIRNAFANRVSRRIGSSLTPLFTLPVEWVVEQLIDLRASDLDPAKALEKARCPILVLAGDSEQVLRVVEIEYLYGSIPEPKRLTIFPGAGHEDLLVHDPRRYIRAVSDFLREFAPCAPRIGPS